MSAPSSPDSSSSSALSSSGSATQSSATSADLPPSPSPATLSLPAPERRAAALALKDAGNALFLRQEYEAAKTKYGEGIALDEGVATLWSNRAACELKLEQHGLAIEDATRAIQLDASFAKAYYRRASAHLSILDAKAALPDLRTVAQLEPRNAAVRAQLDATTKLLRRMQFEKAIAKDAGPKNWQTAARHLKEGSGGTQVPESYEGPRLEEGEEGTEEEVYSKGTHLGKITQTFIDEMITHFKDGKRLPLRYAWQIMLGAQRAFLQEGPLVEYNIPEGRTIDVIGDTHGQFYDFIHLLSLTGHPSASHALLFNGDAVDRGSWSCEIVLTILAYKWLFPKSCFFNRGNHETHGMNQVYGFEGECKAKFGGDLTYKIFTELFVALPLSTLISAPRAPLQGADLPQHYSQAQRSPILSPEGRKRFFVVHGGLFSKDGVTLEDIKAIDRFKGNGQPGSEGLVVDMLWADPQAANGRGPSKRGVGLGFGPDITRAWCELNGVTAVLRSHEVRQEGYSEEHDSLCVTLFSAPNYVDQVGNKGAFARIDDQGTMTYQQFSCQPHPDIKPMAYTQPSMGGMLS